MGEGLPAGDGVGGWGGGIKCDESCCCLSKPLIPCSLREAARPGTAAARLIFPAGVFISGAEILISLAEATQSMARSRPLLGLQLFVQTISNRQNFIILHAESFLRVLLFFGGGGFAPLVESL